MVRLDSPRIVGIWRKLHPVSDGKFESSNQAQISATTLGLLDAVEDGAPVTQRGLAVRLGIALGLTNSLLKRCVRKGLVKVSQAPARRYAYYLTPKGFREKSRLTAQYLSTSLHFYRRARGEYLEAVDLCRSRGWTRVALYGTTELAEIATLAALEAGLRFEAIIDPARNEDQFFGVPVARAFDELPDGVDAIMITSTQSPQQAFDDLAAAFPAERIITPPLLHVSRSRRQTTRSGAAE